MTKKRIKNNVLQSKFKYIYDNYYKGTIRQLTNIWFYLKEYQNTKYVLKATKKDYINFIKNNYQIEIKNFDKSINKYFTRSMGFIDTLREVEDDS